VSYESVKTLLPHLTKAYTVRTGVADQADSKGKVQANYLCVREATRTSLFKDHFEGRVALSVQPITDTGNTCQWGCLDIDDYDHTNLEVKVRKACDEIGFKYYLDRSKSGGVHVYIILSSPTTAKLFRDGLRKISNWMGFPKTELRPAQDSLDLHAGDLGTPIILPGFGQPWEIVSAEIKKALMTPAEFLAVTDEGEFWDGPPCLFPLARKYTNTGDWQFRNMFLYQLAVFYKLKYPSDWIERVFKYNDEVVKPSLEDKELRALVDQLERNAKCHFTCKSEPFESVCNRTACQARSFGVAAKEGVGGLLSPEGITVLDTDPPIWFVTLTNPKTNETCRVKLSTSQLQLVSLFKKRCLEVMKFVPTLPVQKEWEAWVGQLLEGALVIPVPFEATEEARILDLLYRYCRSSIKSREMEDLLKSRAIVQKEESGMRVTFRLVDFRDYLDRNRSKGVTAKDLYSLMRALSDIGKVSAVKVSVPPLTIEAWTIVIDSKYLELKIEMDLE
jgi:hypothetical protein